MFLILESILLQIKYMLLIADLDERGIFGGESHLKITLGSSCPHTSFISSKDDRWSDEGVQAVNPLYTKGLP